MKVKRVQNKEGRAMRDNKTKMSARIIAGVLVFLMIAVAVGTAVGLIIS